MMGGVSEHPTIPAVTSVSAGMNFEVCALPETNDQDVSSGLDPEVSKDMVAKAMTLDVAYQSLEMVRKVNLHVEFGKEVEENHCVPCLRAEHSSNVVMSKFGKWISKKASDPCLTCGSPVCSYHRSSDFSKQNITVCSDCAQFYSSSHLVHYVMREAEPVEKKKRINNMLEVYDRALLVLLYSTQFIDEVAASLRGNTSRHNKIGLGSSATGVVAGSLGVAGKYRDRQGVYSWSGRSKPTISFFLSSSAACTIFTPVGPPLLLASILFGGGATAVNAGSEAVNYRCEPNKMADRILTLHSIISSIADLPKAMDQDAKIEEEKRATLLRAEATQSRLHLTRVAMNGLKPLTSGALSAISIVTEARELKNTVDRIRAGNPCEKAERLMAIKDEVFDLPKTETLSSQLWMIISRLHTREAEADEVVGTEVPATLSQYNSIG